MDEAIDEAIELFADAALVAEDMAEDIAEEAEDAIIEEAIDAEEGIIVEAAEPLGVMDSTVLELSTTNCGV